MRLRGELLATATVSGLSVKALRLYSDSGLLPPAHVDPDTGYRWYHRDQLHRARTITLLRGLDMPLASVQEVLDLPESEVAAALERYWHTLEHRHLGRRRLLTFLLDRYRERTLTMYDVTVSETPARTLLSIQEHLGAEGVPSFYTRWCHRLGDLELEVPDDGEAPFLRYHGSVGADGDGPVEFCCPIPDDAASAAVEAFPELSVRHESAGHEAALVVPRQDMFTPLGFEALQRWRADRGATDQPPVRQRFLPGMTGEPTEPAYELAAPYSP